MPTSIRSRNAIVRGEARTVTAAASLMLMTVAGLSAARGSGTNRVEIGILTCLATPGTHRTLLVHSSVDMKCMFSHDELNEYYGGRAGIWFGLDLKLSRWQKLAFTVLGNTDAAESATDILTGKYYGPRASLIPGLGGGLSILAGRGGHNVSLQPMVEASYGIGATAGVGYLYLWPSTTSHSGNDVMGPEDTGTGTTGTVAVR